MTSRNAHAAIPAIDAWWRAANYLSVGQIYLHQNPLLREPLASEHIKERLLGHWGTNPGLNFIYAHLNRVINEFDANMIYVTGPGHGGPALIANTWLEGTYSEVYPDVDQTEAGIQRMFKEFSFPGGVPSHCAPEVPGSIHEGGELGYALSHACGAAFDNPDLIVACIVGDGEAETGPLAASWIATKYLNPASDGTVLPILHLNGWKIANPTLFARMSDDDLRQYFGGLGYEAIFVEGDDPDVMHPLMIKALDKVMFRLADIKSRTDEEIKDWPMIVLRTPKGWTGPEYVDDTKISGTWRSHQVPLANAKSDDVELDAIGVWMGSYRPEELFDEAGRPVDLIRNYSPQGARRMGANPNTNGGKLLKDLRLPKFADYAVPVPAPATVVGEATRVLGTYLRDVFARNADQKNFCLVGPDETDSNRLSAVYESTGKRHLSAVTDDDLNLSRDGRVFEILSEHVCQGWLEGYLLTGRHGLFSCYEAFINIVTSMFNQHAKWLKVCNEISWRRPIASLNYLLTSHVWRQDHNGYSHQDPGFIDHVINKKAEVVRVYLPPDANTLLHVADQCLRSKNRVNVIVAGKQEQLQFLSMEEAIKHCTKGIGIWPWASNDFDDEPDVVIASAGDVPTLESLAAVSILRRLFPDLKIRYVNVVDLLTLQSESEHPSALSNAEFDSLFTTDKPVIFAYHGYPWLIHRLTYRRTNHDNFRVRGYKEEGTTTTPFDMAVLNEIDRFSLAIDAIERVPSLQGAAHEKQVLRDKLIEHKQYIHEHGLDLPEIVNWKWPANLSVEAPAINDAKVAVG